jgi:hypothetical protein
MNQRVKNLADFRQQMLDGIGGAGYEFELTYENDGTPTTEVFVVPHPLAVEDEQSEAVDAAGTDSVEIARALMNTPDDPQKYERFKKAGGRASDVILVWRQMSQRMAAAKSL